MARTGEDEKEYLPKRQRPETECRLIVLLLLSGLPEAADTFLLRCCSDGELLTYFELMPALSSLTREGQVVRRMDGTSWRYRLTQAGQETLALFLARIPESDRQTVRSLLPGWQEALRRKREFTASMKQGENGEYDVLLSVTDRGTPILSLSMPVPSSELAARLTERWEQKGAEVYQELIRLMTGQEEL